MLECFFGISWTPIVAAVLGVAGSSLLTQYWICRQKKETQQFLSGALIAEISLIFDNYVDYEFPEDTMERRFVHQIEDVPLFEPSLDVFQNNTDKLGTFQVNDTKKIIEFYANVQKISQMVRLLSIRVQEYKEAIRRSNNVPREMNENLPIANENVRKAIEQIQSKKEITLQLRQDVVDILMKYE